MNRLLLYTSFLLFLSCNQKSEKVETKHQLYKRDPLLNTYKYDGYFYCYVDFGPAFLTPSRITIIHENRKTDTGAIKFTLYQRSEDDNNWTIQHRDSAILNKQELKEFFKHFDTISMLKIKPNFEMGLDGVGVNITCYLDTSKNEFNFWSPIKGTKENKMSNHLISLCEKKFTQQNEKEYLKALKEYFQ
jgi:hypothetical protein